VPERFPDRQRPRNAVNSALASRQREQVALGKSSAMPAADRRNRRRRRRHRLASRQSAARLSIRCAVCGDVRNTADALDPGLDAKSSTPRPDKAAASRAPPAPLRPIRYEAASHDTPAGRVLVGVDDERVEPSACIAARTRSSRASNTASGNSTRERASRPRRDCFCLLLLTRRLRNNWRGVLTTPRRHSRDER